MCARRDFPDQDRRLHPDGAVATLTRPERDDDPHRRGRPQALPALPRRPDDAIDAIALLDVADVMQAVQEASCAMSCPGRSALDLRILHGWLRSRFGARRFICVAPENPMMPAEGTSRIVTAHSGWEWVVPHRRTWGHDVPPTAAFICATLECLRFELESAPLRTAVVISHRNIFAEPMTRLARAGGHAIGVGLIERLGDELIELIDEPRCQLLDLQFDARAARLPDRLLFRGPDPLAAEARYSPPGPLGCRSGTNSMSARAS